MKGRNGNKYRSLTTLAVMALIMSVLVAVPAAADTTVFDDMEHGDPFGNGWFAFGGSVGGGGIGPNGVDLPPSDGGAFSLETGWGSGGTGSPPGSYAPSPDDDIVARQLREAAEKETDPELKAKLWKEYEEYKKSRARP